MIIQIKMIRFIELTRKQQHLLTLLFKNSQNIMFQNAMESLDVGILFGCSHGRVLLPFSGVRFQAVPG